MARPLQERSSSEPGGSIQVEANRTFPPHAVSSSSSTICEPSIALSHRTGHNSRASSHQRTSARIIRCRASRRAGSDCDESELSSSTCGQTHCRLPESFSTAEPTYPIRQSPSHQYSRMEAGATAHGDLSEQGARGEQPRAREEEIEREIAIRLRRIGDQMNELYLQRRVVGERQWWRPLRWHLTQFISEILAALYNPLLDILPHN
ncbi:bcl-2-binding component 3 [Discoglossus pictus]